MSSSRSSSCRFESRNLFRRELGNGVALEVRAIVEGEQHRGDVAIKLLARIRLRLYLYLRLGLVHFSRGRLLRRCIVAGFVLRHCFSYSRVITVSKTSPPPGPG